MDKRYHLFLEYAEDPCRMLAVKNRLPGIIPDRGLHDSQLLALSETVSRSELPVPEPEFGND